jgi:hypothetical protein
MIKDQAQFPAAWIHPDFAHGYMRLEAVRLRHREADR